MQNRRRNWLVVWMLLLTQMKGAEESELPASAPREPVALHPIYRVMAPDEEEKLATSIDADKDRAAKSEVVFLAVVTNRWLPGLIPLFAIETETGFRLSRQPPPGEERFLEPLFFALPPEEEAEASRVSGHWECRATRGDGTLTYFGWDLAIDKEKAFGRFDPDTDYKFASITRGSFLSNRLELRVEYIADVYLLTGAWRENRLQGEWVARDSSETGTWSCHHTASYLLPANQTCRLYEWTDASGRKRRYGIENETAQPNWNRAKTPLCRVWRRPEK